MTEEKPTYTANVVVRLDDLKIERKVMDKAIASAFFQTASWYQAKQVIIDVLEGHRIEFVEAPPTGDYGSDEVVVYHARGELIESRHVCRDWAAAIGKALDIILRDCDE